MISRSRAISPLPFGEVLPHFFNTDTRKKKTHHPFKLVAGIYAPFRMAFLENFFMFFLWKKDPSPGKASFMTSGLFAWTSTPSTRTVCEVGKIWSVGNPVVFLLRTGYSLEHFGRTCGVVEWWQPGWYVEFTLHAPNFQDHGILSYALRQLFLHISTNLLLWAYLVFTSTSSLKFHQNTTRHIAGNFARIATFAQWLSIFLRVNGLVLTWCRVITMRILGWHFCTDAWQLYESTSWCLQIISLLLCCHIDVYSSQNTHQGFVHQGHSQEPS